MRFARILTVLPAIFAVGALALHPGCASHPSNGFAPMDDASVDAPMMTGLNFDAQIDGAITSEAGFRDGKPEIDGTGCVPDASGPGPVQHICVIFPAGSDDGNECDGHHDLPGFPANGTTGNGFDDNCNGLVDEGCDCEAVGATKTCYLVPASQTVNGLPVGWCTENSKGTVACAKLSGEGSPQWSGTCRGAQPPFADDFCAPGDFNCDGKEENSTTQNCSCAPGTIQCPTSPLSTVPYPSPSALPLAIDAGAWFVTQSDVAISTGWKWTLTGGDCDNILPFPTFGMYPTNDGTGNPVGTLATNLGQSGSDHGIVASAPTVESSVYPAFSLSGDYTMTTEWDLRGKHYSCVEKIQVRAPGLRAEACWDTEKDGVDLDLHLAKVDDFPECMTSHGWSDLSCQGEDCYYGNCYTPNGMFPDWGYTSSPSTACTGWGSEAGQAVSSCGNPRLDRDANGLSGTCDPTNANPNGGGTFCGPENVNVDAPDDGSRFAVAVRYYNGSPPSHTHVDVYCDGVRIFASGFDPTTMSEFPALRTAGQDSTGDMWKVGLVTTNVTPMGLSCTAQGTTSQNPHPLTDGSQSYCVDNATTDGMESAEHLAPGGYEPLNAAAMCFH